MTNEQTITGIILLIIGLILSFFSIFCGLLFLIIGIILIVYRNEENKIEKRKDLKQTKNLKKHERSHYNHHL